MSSGNPSPPTPPDRVGPDTRSPWVRALDAIDESRQIPFFGDKFDDEGRPAVVHARFSKKAPDQEYWPTWIKQYQSNSKYNLLPFNEWERDLLRLARPARGLCYQLVAFGETTTYLNEKTGSLMRGVSTLETSSKGPTLRDWLGWPVHVQGSRLGHAFLPTGNYLRFARGALQAINALHDKCNGLVHCDLNQGNWCLRARFTHFPGPQERVRLEIDWGSISTIDLGYSTHPSMNFKVLPPLHGNSISPHLRAAFVRALNEGKAAYDDACRDDPGTARRWPDFDAATWEPQFWSSCAPEALDGFRRVDWREDYWKLGTILQALRGGLDSDPAHGPVTRSPRVVRSELNWVNSLVGEPEQLDDDGQLIPGYGLAETLTAWGGHRADYDGIADAKARLKHSRELRDKTYQDLLQQLDGAIAALPPQDFADTVFLHRADIDTGEQAAQPVQHAAPTQDPARPPPPDILHMDQDRLDYLAQREHQRQEQARRQATVRKLLRRLAAGAALAAGAVAAGVYWGLPAWQRWQDTQARVAYEELTDQVEASPWWLKGVSRKLKPDAQQRAWGRETLVQGRRGAWVRAQFALGALHCSGTLPEVAPLSTRRCGELLAQALANPAALPELPMTRKLAIATASMFDDLVLGYANGQAHNDPPDYAFAQALLPGLLAQQGPFPGLGLRAALVQACAGRPARAQRAEAATTLQRVLRQHPGTGEAAQAGTYLSRWAAGDYSQCR